MVFARVQKLLSRSVRGSKGRPAPSVALLVEIDRAALGVEAYALSPDERELVSEVIAAGPVHASDPPREMIVPTGGKRDLEAHLKEIGNRVDSISSRLLDAVRHTRQAERLNREIEARLGAVKEMLCIIEERVIELDGFLEE
jgi:hypothetical protein